MGLIKKKKDVEDDTKSIESQSPEKESKFKRILKKKNRESELSSTPSLSPDQPEDKKKHWYSMGRKRKDGLTSMDSIAKSNEEIEEQQTIPEDIVIPIKSSSRDIVEQRSRTNSEKSQRKRRPSTPRSRQSTKSREELDKKEDFSTALLKESNSMKSRPRKERQVSEDSIEMINNQTSQKIEPEPIPLKSRSRSNSKKSIKSSKSVKSIKSHKSTRSIRDPPNVPEIPNDILYKASPTIPVNRNPSEEDFIADSEATNHLNSITTKHQSHLKKDSTWPIEAQQLFDYFNTEFPYIFEEDFSPVVLALSILLNKGPISSLDHLSHLILKSEKAFEVLVHDHYDQFQSSLESYTDLIKNTSQSMQVTKTSYINGSTILEDIKQPIGDLDNLYTKSISCHSQLQTIQSLLELQRILDVNSTNQLQIATQCQQALVKCKDSKFKDFSMTFLVNQFELKLISVFDTVLFDFKDFLNSNPLIGVLYDLVSTNTHSKSLLTSSISTYLQMTVDTITVLNKHQEWNDAINKHVNHLLESQFVLLSFKLSLQRPIDPNLKEQYLQLLSKCGNYYLILSFCKMNTLFITEHLLRIINTLTSQHLQTSFKLKYTSIQSTLFDSNTIIEPSTTPITSIYTLLVLFPSTLHLLSLLQMKDSQCFTRLEQLLVEYFDQLQSEVQNQLTLIVNNSTLSPLQLTLSIKTLLNQIIFCMHQLYYHISEYKSICQLCITSLVDHFHSLVHNLFHSKLASQLASTSTNITSANTTDLPTGISKSDLTDLNDLQLIKSISNALVPFISELLEPIDMADSTILSSIEESTYLDQIEQTEDIRLLLDTSKLVQLLDYSLQLLQLEFKCQCSYYIEMMHRQGVYHHCKIEPDHYVYMLNHAIMLLVDIDERVLESIDYIQELMLTNIKHVKELDKNGLMKLHKNRTSIEQFIKNYKEIDMSKVEAFYDLTLDKQWTFKQHYSSQVAHFLELQYPKDKVKDYLRK